MISTLYKLHVETLTNDFGPGIKTSKLFRFSLFATDDGKTNKQKNYEQDIYWQFNHELNHN